MASAKPVDDAASKAKAAALKEQGNAAVAGRKFLKAYDLYSEAIRLDSSNHVLYSNRSGVCLDLGRIEDAEKDARRCTELNAGWAKGFWRLGQAYEAQKRWDDAVDSYKRGVAVDGSNADLRKSLEAAEKAAAAADAARGGEPIHRGPTLSDCLAAATRMVSPSRLRASALAAGQSLSLHARRFANVRLTLLPGRGRALVAARALGGGEEVFEEGCIAWSAPLGGSLGSLMPALLETSPAMQRAADGGDGRDMALGILAQLTPYGDDSVAYDGHHAAAEDVDDAVTETEMLMRLANGNALAASFNDNLPVEQRHLHAFAPVASMMNHSCDPNAGVTFSWSEEKGCPVARVYSKRAIAAEEEVTIAYVELTTPKQPRRRKLRVQYGFGCACARCMTPWEDTVVFKCPACADGRVFLAATACADCGAPLADPSVAGVDGPWNKAHRAFLARERELAEIVLCDRPTPVYLELAGKAALSPSALLDRDTPVHVTDTARLQLAYNKMYQGWQLPPRLSVDVFSVLIPAYTRSGLWTPNLPQLTVLAGHVFAHAGLLPQAKEMHARAARLHAEVYGPGAAYTRIVRGFAEKPPSERADVQKQEKKRVEAGDWVSACGLPKRHVVRWLITHSLNCHPAVLQKPAEAPPAEAAVMRQLVALRDSVRAKIQDMVVRSIAEEEGLRKGAAATPGDTAAAGAATAAGGAAGTPPA